MRCVVGVVSGRGSCFFFVGEIHYFPPYNKFALNKVDIEAPLTFRPVSLDFRFENFLPKNKYNDSLQSSFLPCSRPFFQG